MSDAESDLFGSLAADDDDMDVRGIVRDDSCELESDGPIGPRGLQQVEGQPESEGESLGPAGLPDFDECEPEPEGDAVVEIGPVVRVLRAAGQPLTMEQWIRPGPGLQTEMLVSLEQSIPRPMPSAQDVEAVLNHTFGDTHHP